MKEKQKRINDKLSTWDQLNRGGEGGGGEKENFILTNLVLHITYENIWRWILNDREMLMGLNTISLPKESRFKIHEKAYREEIDDET